MKQKGQAYSFKLNTLDDFAKSQKIKKIDFLNLDVEGAELAVLQGAGNLLKNKNISFIQFEFNEMDVYSRTFFKDFVDILPNHLFYRIMPNGLYKLGPYRPSTHEIFAFQNIFCTPRQYEHLIDQI